MCPIEALQSVRAKLWASVLYLIVIDCASFFLSPLFTSFSFCIFGLTMPSFLECCRETLSLPSLWSVAGRLFPFSLLSSFACYLPSSLIHWSSELSRSTVSLFPPDLFTHYSLCERLSLSLHSTRPPARRILCIQGKGEEKNPCTVRFF